jgi:hypothetical protein
MDAEFAVFVEYFFYVQQRAGIKNARFWHGKEKPLFSAAKNPIQNQSSC